MGAATSSPACEVHVDTSSNTSAHVRRFPSDIEERILRLIGGKEVQALFLTSKAVQQAVRPVVLETETFIFKSPQSYQRWRAFFPVCKARLSILDDGDAWDNGSLALLAPEPRIEYIANVPRGDEGECGAANGGLEQLTSVQELKLRLGRRIGQRTPTLAFLSQMRHLRVLDVGCRFNPLRVAQEGMFNASALSWLARSLEHLVLQSQGMRVDDLPLSKMTRLQSLKLFACSDRPELQPAEAGAGEDGEAAATSSTCGATHVELVKCVGTFADVLGECVNAEELNIDSDKYDSLQNDGMDLTSGMRRLRSLTIRGHTRHFFRSFLGDLGGSLEKLVLRGTSPNSRVLRFRAAGFPFAAMVKLQELTLENCSFPDYSYTRLRDRDCFPALRKLTMTRCRSDEGIILQACRTATIVHISRCALPMRAFGGLSGVEQLQLEHYFRSRIRDTFIFGADNASVEALDGDGSDDDRGIHDAERDTTLAALSAQLSGMRSLKSLTVRALDRDHVQWGLLEADLARSNLRGVRLRMTNSRNRWRSYYCRPMGYLDDVVDTDREESPFAVFEQSTTASDERTQGQQKEDVQERDSSGPSPAPAAAAVTESRSASAAVSAAASRSSPGTGSDSGWRSDYQGDGVAARSGTGASAAATSNAAAGAGAGVDA